MKKSRIFPVIRIVLAVLVTLLLVSESCTSRKGKAEHKDLIPEEDLIPILTDLYLTDGILSIPKIRLHYQQVDSLAPYKDIIAGHGYDMETMDRTMKFYFVRKPKKLIRIYDRVLSRLSTMESEYMSLMPEVSERKGDLWEGRSFYHLPGLAASDTGNLSTLIRRQGNYTLQYTLTIFPDDRIPAPSIGLYFCSPDSLDTGKRYYYHGFPYLGDGRPHRYVAVMRLETSQPMVLRGWFVDMKGLSSDTSAHHIVEDISLTYSIIRR
ncbi:MAG: DUF4296 domain-containing protein [Bacteroidales bacterium]|jgi:hypothetical protein|nr:DUF4296 domain-containing protein [Bacteroidales bacterium]